MHQKALLREEGLKQEIKEKDGQIRDLKNRLFGKKSEKKTSKNSHVLPGTTKHETLANRPLKSYKLYDYSAGHMT